MIQESTVSYSICTNGSKLATKVSQKLAPRRSSLVVSIRNQNSSKLFQDDRSFCIIIPYLHNMVTKYSLWGAVGRWEFRSLTDRLTANTHPEDFKSNAKTVMVRFHSEFHSYQYQISRYFTFSHQQTNNSLLKHINIFP